jgi:hypothetical protein
MNNSTSDQNKYFYKENQEIQKSSLKTLPTMITICLAPCDLCTGEYVDSMHSFRLRCLCPCGHREKSYDAITNEFKPTNPVWIPFQQYLAEALPSNRGPTMRTASHVGSLLDTVALTNSNFMVDYGSIGEKQVVARPQDLAEVIRITNNMTSSATTAFHQIK